MSLIKHPVHWSEYGHSNTQCWHDGGRLAPASEDTSVLRKGSSSNARNQEMRRGLAGLVAMAAVRPSPHQPDVNQCCILAARLGFGYLTQHAVPMPEQSLHDLNHSSCRRSLAAGLSLGYNFIILELESLSSLLKSLHLQTSKKVNEAGFSLTWSITIVRIPSGSSCAISSQLSGSGPKCPICSTRTQTP